MQGVGVASNDAAIIHNVTVWRPVWGESKAYIVNNNNYTSKGGKVHNMTHYYVRMQVMQM